MLSKILCRLPGTPLKLHNFSVSSPGRVCQRNGLQVLKRLGRRYRLGSVPRPRVRSIISSAAPTTMALSATLKVGQW